MRHAEHGTAVHHCMRASQGILATGSEDKQVLVWDVEAESDSKKAKAGVPAELLFVHAGHQHGKVGGTACVEQVAMICDNMTYDLCMASMLCCI
jgi:hypothetical protein